MLVDAAGDGLLGEVELLGDGSRAGVSMPLCEGPGEAEDLALLGLGELVVGGDGEGGHVGC